MLDKIKAMFYPTPKPEIISVHIPKTAGTSFYNTLLDEYGQNELARLDIKPALNLMLLNFEPFHKPEIKQAYKIIHGHFSPKMLYEKFPIYQDIPLITWVRNPVDRVISNYYYMVERLTFFLAEHEKTRSIRDKMMKSLEEFVCTEINQNVSAHHLDGVALEDYKFIGILESYDQELLALAKLLNWKNAKRFDVNITEKAPKQIDPAIRKLIETNNELDMDIYEKSIALMQKRNKA